MHLGTAVKFVRDQEARVGAIPGTEALEDWAKAMDLNGYRVEGHGFTLDQSCESNASEFCISFWTGDDFVTYKSWQITMDKVIRDDPPLSWALGSLLVGLSRKI